MSPPTNDEDLTLARWYRDELLVHEGELRGYLKRAFPALTGTSEIVEDSISKVLAAHRARPIRSVKAYLFTTARNLAYSHLRRRQIVAIDSVEEIEALRVYDEGPSVPEVVGTKLELEILTEAIQSLPDRCRQVITLRRIYGLSQKEIAVRLGISEHTVEAQLGKAMRRCAEFLRSRGVLGEERNHQ